MNIYERIYQKLEKIGIMNITGSVHLKSKSFMDLVVERLGDNHYSLTHYYELNGDLCPNPDMEVKIIPDQKIGEALSYQDQFGYRQVYERNKVDLKAKKELNAFLDFWLTNLINQGFAQK
ncbi:MAG: DUF1249 domain-containing protein [Candidatus Methanoperedens sp.]|nr:DUF1249 domain-containing protein [Candidatus Methanoperedens sp.]